MNSSVSWSREIWKKNRASLERKLPRICMSFECSQFRILRSLQRPKLIFDIYGCSYCMKICLAKTLSEMNFAKLSPWSRHTDGTASLKLVREVNISSSSKLNIPFMVNFIFQDHIITSSCSFLIFDIWMSSPN